MDLGALRVTLASRLGNITGLTSYSRSPGTPNVPCAIVMLGVIQLGVALDETSDTVNFTIEMLVQLADWQSAQTAMDLYCSDGNPESVVDALTAGDISIQVDTISPQGTATLGDVTYGSVTFAGRALF